MIQLIQSSDGRLVIGSNQPFPNDVGRVEYFRDLKLMMLIFEGENEESDLMPCEITDEVAKIIHQAPEIVIIEESKLDIMPYGYIAPLIQIGV
jgi:hypothetical protein